MITAICIPADTDQPLRQEELEARHLPAFQALVGGSIEPIELYRPGGTMYVNEEGKNLGLRPNPRATALASVHNSRFRGMDIVAGDAIVVGPLDGRSLDTTVSKRYVELWFEARAFRVKKRVAGKPRWLGSKRTFDNVMVAYVYAVRLAGREADIEEVRVVPVPGGGPLS